MLYIDLLMKKSIKNTIKILENIIFSQKEQKQLVKVLIQERKEIYF